jgi:hypothetical protein
MVKSEFIFFRLIGVAVSPVLPLEQAKRSKMAALIAFVVGVPIAVMLSVWSDVGTIQESIEKRKLDASLLGMPGDYHTHYDQARREDRT